MCLFSGIVLFTKFVLLVIVQEVIENFTEYDVGHYLYMENFHCSVYKKKKKRSNKSEFVICDETEVTGEMSPSTTCALTSAFGIVLKRLERCFKQYFCET